MGCIIAAAPTVIVYWSHRLNIITQRAQFRPQTKVWQPHQEVFVPGGVIILIHNVLLAVISTWRRFTSSLWTAQPPVGLVATLLINFTQLILLTENILAEFFCCRFFFLWLSILHIAVMGIFLPEMFPLPVVDLQVPFSDRNRPALNMQIVA